MFEGKQHEQKIFTAPGKGVPDDRQRSERDRESFCDTQPSKGNGVFFSDIHGEYEAFLHMLKSASGMIKNKIDITLGKSVSGAEREALAYLIYYPDKQLKTSA